MLTPNFIEDAKHTEPKFSKRSFGFVSDDAAAIEKEKDDFRSRTAKVPVFSGILGEVPLGRTILLLYDPDAQTTSLLVNVSAEYLRAGGDLLYFCSCQPVAATWVARFG